MIADKYFIPELIEDENIIFNKDSESQAEEKRKEESYIQKK